MRYQAPATVDEAVALLAAANGDARVLAGDGEIDLFHLRLFLEQSAQGNQGDRDRIDVHFLPAPCTGYQGGGQGFMNQVFRLVDR